MPRATKANPEGAIMDAAGGFVLPPFPAGHLAQGLGLNGDNERVRRSIGRYLYWRLMRHRALLDARIAQTNNAFWTTRQRINRLMRHASDHHRRVLYHLAQARAADRERV